MLVAHIWRYRNGLVLFSQTDCQSVIPCIGVLLLLPFFPRDKRLKEKRTQTHSQSTTEKKNQKKQTISTCFRQCFKVSKFIHLDTALDTCRTIPVGYLTLPVTSSYRLVCSFSESVHLVILSCLPFFYSHFVLSRGLQITLIFSWEYWQKNFTYILLLKNETSLFLLSNETNVRQL